MDNKPNKLMLGLKHLYPENLLIKNLARAVETYPEIVNEDFLSQGQVESKRWIIEELNKLKLDLGTVYLIAGWYGLLAQFLNEAKMNFTRIRSFDIDQRSIEISEMMNRSLFVDGWKFKATCKDAFAINYTDHEYVTLKEDKTDNPMRDVPDTIVNSACEHFDYQAWLDLIPEGKLLILQNNDFFGCDGHTHCASSLEEFIEKCALREIHYSGVLKLKNYNRFMLIGRK